MADTLFETTYPELIYLGLTGVTNMYFSNTIVWPRTPTPTLTPTVTPTITPTITPTVSGAVITPTVTPSLTVSITQTPSVTPSLTPTLTPSVTPTLTVSITQTPSVTPTLTVSNTPSKTPSVTPSLTVSITRTPTVTPTLTVSITRTPTVTPTLTVSITRTPSLTVSITRTPSPTITPSTSNTLINGLISYWKCDETGVANAVDELGVTTLTNTKCLGASGGLINNSFILSGTTCFLGGNAGTTYQYTTGVSVSIWFSGSTYAAYQALINDYGSAGTGNGYDLIIQDNGKSSWNLRSTGATPTTVSINDPTTVITNSAWHHIVGTFNGTTVQSYVDGGALTSQTWANNISYGGVCTFKIGTRGSGDIPLRGRLDQIGIWNRGLTAAEVTNLYNKENGGTGYPWT